MGHKLSSDLVFLILQFLNENEFSETARKLEQESRCYFNMEYFESQVLTGEWDNADCYLSSFTTVEENSHSTKTFFKMRKQKYLEALDILNWQHQHCKHPASIPDIKTLFFDHICAPPGESLSHTNNSIVGVIQQCVPYFPVPTHAGVDLSGRCRLSLTGQMANSEPPIPHPLVPAGTGNAFPPQNGGLLKQIRSPTAIITGYQFSGSVHVTKCSRVGPSVVNNADSNRRTDLKENVQDEDANKIKKLCLANVSHPIHCKTRKLRGISKGKIVQILVTNSGCSLLALDSNACCQRWDWDCNEGNPTGKVTATILKGLASGNHSTTHDSNYKDPEKQISCMVVSNNDEYILSTCGREVSLSKSKTFELVTVLLPCSPRATSFAFHPKDNNIIAFGLENSKILIRHVKNGTTKMLEGHHQKEITCVTFSLSLDLLISAGADGLLCAWSLNECDIQQEQFVYPHGERSSSPVGISKINFHKDQVYLLVVQENQIVISDCSTFDQACHWQTKDPMPAPISSAQYSCDSQLVYASFCDGAIGVFDADTLVPLFCVPPAAFFPSGRRRNNIYPLAIAAHPHEYKELAIGFSDGTVHLLQLVELEGDEAVGSLENGEGTSEPSTSNHGSELP